MQKAFFTFCIILLTFGAIAQKERTVYGKVIDVENGKPINSVTVVNQRSKQRAVSNERGDFFIWAIAGDSIKTVAIGYVGEGIKYDGTSNKPTITMKIDAIALAEVVITEKRNENLQAEIAAFLKNPGGAKGMREEIMKNMIQTQNLSQPGIGISIDALYDMFSKQGKSRQKVAELEMLDAKKFYAELRYNKRWVNYLTKLEGDELDVFMKFCPMTDDYILRASDYDLTYEVFKCFRQFKR
ncbi:MAG: carboxypeptidase-like regulatory domain-containing protein [Spirosomaceae bacterium]|nr:carboxypeptidase-like regulatory domain-containing protein [Spirosomataceae bacterium]